MRLLHICQRVTGISEMSNYITCSTQYQFHFSQPFNRNTKQANIGTFARHGYMNVSCDQVVLVTKLLTQVWLQVHIYNQGDFSKSTHTW